MSLVDYQNDLTNVNAAITRLLEGKAVTELRIGSGATLRYYKYTEITLDSLTALRNELLAKIQTLSSDTPVFRTNASIPLRIIKGF